MFSVLDVEMVLATQYEGIRELFSITGFDVVYLTKDTRLQFRITPNGTEFTASEDADVQDPEDALLLSEEQRTHSATFHFKDTGSFRLLVHYTSATSNDNTDGRNVFIGSAA